MDPFAGRLVQMPCARLPVEFDQQVLPAPGVPVANPDHHARDRRLQADVDVAGVQFARQGFKVRYSHDRFRQRVPPMSPQPTPIEYEIDAANEP